MPKKKPEKKKKAVKKPKSGSGVASVKSVLHRAAQVAKKVGQIAKTPAPAPKKAEKPSGKISKKGKVPTLVVAKPKLASGKGAKKAPVVPGKGKKGGTAVVEVLLSNKGKEKGAAGQAKISAAPSSPARKKCREPGCDNDALLANFCRLHYIKNWRRIKRKDAILATGQLNNYVEELVSKYPDKYLDVIRQDLASEKDWAKVVVDLELETSDEETAALDEEVESVAAEGTRRERDFDDEGETF